MRVTRRWLILGVAFAFAGGCNCGKKGTGIVGETGIPEAPATLNFGHIAVGQTARLQLQVQNTGAGELDVNSQVISGPPFSEPTQLAVTNLSPGAKTTALLAFMPTAAGPASGTFTIGDDGDPAKLVIALVGTGLDINVSVTPVSLTFGSIPVGLSAPTQTVTLTNTTASPVYVSLGTSGTAPVYSVKDASGTAVTAAPVQLAPNVAYVLTVGFTPNAVSIFNSSFSYTVCQDAASTECLSAQSVTLNGQGISGQIVLTPNPITFSSVPDGTSATQTITVTNAGGAAATVGCIFLQSQGQVACMQASPSFTIGMPSLTTPTTLAAGGSFTLPLTYQSTGATPVSDTLTAEWVVQGGSTNQFATDPITGSESPSPCTVSLSPTSLSFTYSTAGTPVTEVLTVTNTGGTTCQITAIALDPASDPGYTLSAGQATTLSIAAGSNAPISVDFELAANTPPSTRLGHLDFASTDPAHASIAVPLVASVVSPYAGGGAWPRWHHDNIQSGLSPNDTSALVGTIAWTYNVGAPTTNTLTSVAYDYLNSPVVGSDGTIYQLGMNGTLYAVNPDGTAKWSTPLEGPLADPHPGTPIIASDGSLFVAFGDTTLVNNQNYGLFHVSSAGAIIASIPPSGSGDGFDLPPSLTNGGLLLGADDSSSMGEYPGAFAFQINTNGTLTVAASSQIVDTGFGDQISGVVGPTDVTYWCEVGTCHALSPVTSGFTELPGWPITPNNTESAAADLALDEFVTGNIMMLLGGWSLFEGDQAQQLVSINPTTGATVWSKTLPSPNAAQLDMSYSGLGNASVGNSCPAIGTDGTVYVGNFDGLHAVVGATGAEKAGWPFSTSSDDVLTAPAIGGDGTIFFGTAGGAFYAVTPAGALRFKVSAGGRVAGSPAIGPDGTVYFTADDGNLYAVK